MPATKPSFLTQLMEEAANPRAAAPVKRGGGRAKAFGAGAAVGGASTYAAQRRRRKPVAKAVNALIRRKGESDRDFQMRQAVAVNRVQRSGRHGAWGGLLGGGGVGAAAGAALSRGARGAGALYGGTIGGALGLPAGAVGGTRHGLNRAYREGMTDRVSVGKADGMILNDPFNGGYLEVSKVDILPTNTRSVAPRHRTAPNMGDGQRVRRFKAKGQNQARLHRYHSGDASQDKGGGADHFGSHSRRGISKAASLPNMGGGAEVGRRGTPLSELGKHNRVGHRIPL